MKIHLIHVNIKKNVELDEIRTIFIYVHIFFFQKNPKIQRVQQRQSQMQC